jgi:hypothetical protein
MKKEIQVIKTIEHKIYFPNDFFGGKMTWCAVVLNPGENILKLLSYSPKRYKKKPSTIAWLSIERVLSVAVLKEDLKNYDILFKTEISDTKYQMLYNHWKKNLPKKCAELLESTRTT